MPKGIHKNINPNCRCMICKSKRGEYKGENNPNFNHHKLAGKNIYNWQKLLKCIICGKPISKSNWYNGSKKCKSCVRKGIKRPEHSELMKKRRTIHYCKICKIEISYSAWKYGNRTCKICSNREIAKSNVGKHHTEVTKEKISKKRINDWQNKEYRERQIKSIFKGLNLTPNKPERILGKLLGKDYKFVGNGKVILGGFCPDFININGQKKIVEMYGDYWHTLPDWKERDKRRLITYKELGYSTLIVWQRELKNLEEVENKILEFNKC